MRCTAPGLSIDARAYTLRSPHIFARAHSQCPATECRLSLSATAQHSYRTSTLKLRWRPSTCSRSERCLASAAGCSASACNVTRAGPHGAPRGHKPHALAQEALGALDVLLGAELVGPPQESECLPHCSSLPSSVMWGDIVSQRFAACRRIDNLRRGLRLDHGDQQADTALCRHLPDQSLNQLACGADTKPICLQFINKYAP